MSFDDSQQEKLTNLLIQLMQNCPVEYLPPENSGSRTFYYHRFMDVTNSCSVMTKTSIRFDMRANDGKREQDIHYFEITLGYEKFRISPADIHASRWKRLNAAFVKADEARRDAVRVRQQKLAAKFLDTYFN